MREATSVTIQSSPVTKPSPVTALLQPKIANAWWKIRGPTPKTLLFLQERVRLPHLAC